jgi:hypothetical protein
LRFQRPECEPTRNQRRGGLNRIIRRAAKLTVPIVAPAVGLVVARYTTRVNKTSADVLEPEIPRNRSRYDLRIRVRIADPELPSVGFAPTEAPPGRRNTTSGGKASAHRLEGMQDNSHWRQTRGCAGRITKLAVRIPSPAIRNIPHTHRAGVLPPWINLPDADGDGNARRQSTSDRSAVAKLTEIVQAPTEEHAVNGHTAGV